MSFGYGYSEQQSENDINYLISCLNMMDDAVAEKVAEGLREGAEIIVREQRRFISGRSSKLPELLKSGKIVKTKSGIYTIPCGYDSSAIIEGFEGLIMEFGRPGSQSNGVDKNGKPIGKVTPTPHIFRGFDVASDSASEHLINVVSEVIEW